MYNVQLLCTGLPTKDKTVFEAWFWFFCQSCNIIKVHGYDLEKKKASFGAQGTINWWPCIQRYGYKYMYIYTELPFCIKVTGDNCTAHWKEWIIFLTN